MIVTFDHNLIIKLEKAEPYSKETHKLISLHNNGKIDIQIINISASEKLPDDARLSNFSEFTERLKPFFSRSPIFVASPGFWGRMYWGRFTWVGEGTLSKLKEIKAILFPGEPFSLQEFKTKKDITDEAKEIGKWWNRTCDVISMYCHISTEADIYVTCDKNFHKESKKKALLEIGAKAILYPDEALARLNII